MKRQCHVKSVRVLRSVRFSGNQPWPHRTVFRAYVKCSRQLGRLAMLNGQARTNSLLSVLCQSLSWFRMRASCATVPTLHQDDTSLEAGRDAQLAEAWRQNPRERKDWCPGTLYSPRGRAMWAAPGLPDSTPYRPGFIARHPDRHRGRRTQGQKTFCGGRPDWPL